MQSEEIICRPYTKDEIKAIIYQAKKEVFDDFRALWKKCQNHDLRGLMLNDIEEMEKEHLKDFG